MNKQEDKLKEEILSTCQSNWENNRIEWRLPEVVDYVFETSKQETLKQVQDIIENIVCSPQDWKLLEEILNKLKGEKNECVSS